ncbi:hypothetical protein EW026_g1840 [Hermanssonia centrifuga]|uniref:Uncharacterized protein n=1 Tax=Hermanssonia centrifuga TaxID=98765 RepID=A0A4S4KQS9_9APHY|nr:hypothetical protein EW026_g1840 [Hermanssonia centrifuga]
MAEPVLVVPSPSPERLPNDATAVQRDGGSLPMSFPAILRGAGISDRFAHLRTAASSDAAVPVALKKNRRDEKEGKRWPNGEAWHLYILEARFVGNPHIVAASKKDFSVPAPSARATFPQPLPTYLSRNNSIPPAEPTAREPVSANAGRFSLSLKGMRRELRKSGPATELLVSEIEHEIVTWLRDAVWMDPDAFSSTVDPIFAKPIGTGEAIIEVSRTALQMVWSISDDAFARFSKDTTGSRLTYLLRPNVVLPDFLPPQGLDTPPITDLESAMDADSEFFLSDRDSHSDIHTSDIDTGMESELDGAPPPGGLSDIAESAPGSPGVGPASVFDETWSLISGSDAEGGDERERDLARSVRSLDLEDHNHELTPRADTRRRQVPLRSHVWERNRRSASSPSRSPARRNPPRGFPRIDPPALDQTSPRSFYAYLFS